MVAYATSDGDHYNLFINHVHGDDLVVSELELQVSTSATTLATYPFPSTSTGIFVASDCENLENIPYTSCTDKAITVNMIHKPSGQTLFSSSDIVVQMGTPSPSPPSALLTVGLVYAYNDTVGFEIRHDGGDDLNLEDIIVQGSDNVGTMQTATLSRLGTFSVGQAIYATYTYGAHPVGKVISVDIIHVPSAQTIFSSSSITVQSEIVD
jgi:hypothetical protein